MLHLLDFLASSLPKKNYSFVKSAFVLSKNKHFIVATAFYPIFHLSFIKGGKINFDRETAPVVVDVAKVVSLMAT